MTEEEKAALRSILAKAKRNPNLRHSVFDPINVGQKVSAIVKLIADLRKTAKTAGSQAEAAIEERIVELERSKDYWTGPHPKARREQTKDGFEKARDLVDELEAVIPVDPPPPE